MDKKDHMTVPTLRLVKSGDEKLLYRLEMESVERKVIIALAVLDEPESLEDLAQSLEIGHGELEKILAGMVDKGIVARVGVEMPESLEGDEASEKPDEKTVMAKPKALEDEDENEGEDEDEQELDEKKSDTGIQSEATDEAIEYEGPEEVIEVKLLKAGERPAWADWKNAPEKDATEADEDVAEATAGSDETEDDAVEPALKIDRESLEKYFYSLKGKNYYDVLGLSPRANPKQIRRVYYSLVAQYHPDQHSEIEDKPTLYALADIFGILTEAYETLYNKKRRRQYDMTIPEVTGVSEEDDALAALFEGTGDDLAMDEEAMEDEKPGWSFYEIGMEAFRTGDYQTASMNFTLAVNMDPDRNEFHDGLKKAKDILDKRLTEKLMKKSKKQEDDKKFSGALTTLTRAAELQPEDVELRYSIARIRFFKTMERVKAEEDISWALAIDHDHIESLLLMGRIQAGKGNNDAAVETFSHILSISPENKKAKEALELFRK